MVSSCGQQLIMWLPARRIVSCSGTASPTNSRKAPHGVARALLDLSERASTPREKCCRSQFRTENAELAAPMQTGFGHDRVPLMARSALDTILLFVDSSVTKLAISSIGLPSRRMTMNRELLTMNWGSTDYSTGIHKFYLLLASGRR